MGADVFLGERRLGLGAKASDDKMLKREGLSSNDKLRRQLLGRDYKKLQAVSGVRGRSEGIAAVIGSKPQPRRDTARKSKDEDDEGRSSLGHSKRKQKKSETENAEVLDAEAPRAPEATTQAISPPRKRAMNYLDEVLAEKSRKQRKKNKKKHKLDRTS